jgi:hypothetical protein
MCYGHILNYNLLVIAWKWKVERKSISISRYLYKRHTVKAIVVICYNPEGDNAPVRKCDGDNTIVR